MGNTLDWLSLSLTPGLGPSGLWRLVNYFGEPGAVLRASKKQLLAVSGIRESQISALADPVALQKQAEIELQKIDKWRAGVLPFDSPHYPLLLKQLADPPAVLFWRGNINLLNSATLAIVGSRAATSYGRSVAYHLAEKLSRYGLTIVSGMALGIDTAAHRGSLAGGGATIAVFGCGLDVIYPRSNGDLYKELCHQGLLLTEYPFGTKPDGFRFPARNRIIAGLCQGVLVVEAARKSGSLITAQIGLDLGREIFAVPGQVDSVKSEGAHWLLQEGAKLVQNVEDVLVELDIPGLHNGWLGGHNASGANDAKGEPGGPQLEPDAEILLELIEPYEGRKDLLIEQSGLPASRVSELLLLLELEGLVALLPGNMVRRITVTGS